MPGPIYWNILLSIGNQKKYASNRTHPCFLMIEWSSFAVNNWLWTLHWEELMRLVLWCASACFLRWSRSRSHLFAPLINPFLFSRDIFFENLSDGRYWYFENDSAVDFLYKLIVNLSAENTAVEPEELKAFQRVLDIAIDCKLQMIIYFFSWAYHNL